MDRRRYPPDWADIARQIRDQAGDRCEFCGVANRAYGARDRHGEWHDEDAIHGLNSTDGMLLFGVDWDWKMTRIVLTVAHLCHDTTCKDPTHMRALCQKCHLAYDADRHRANAKATNDRKRAERVAATGQLAMTELA